MNREYTSGSYRDLLVRIAERVPDVALGADVMVGFPGEGDDAFRNTLRLVEETPLTHLHVFSYSPRPGTPAAAMQGQVPEPVKKERSSTLRELGRRKLFGFRRSFLHKTLSVVIEEKRNATNGCLTGLSDNYIRIAVNDAGPEDFGKELPVTITEVTKESTCGVLAPAKSSD
jgi:threonylcarbamoyladenosine tRNA methylthiotransferase MtaB